MLNFQSRRRAATAAEAESLAQFRASEQTRLAEAAAHVRAHVLQLLDAEQEARRPGVGNGSLEEITQMI